MRGGPSRKTRTVHLYGLAVAFATVAVAFIVGTIVAELNSRGIDPHVDALQTNALPSIDYLVSAANDLRRLAFQSGALAEGGADRTAELRAVGDLRVSLHRDLDGYLALPTFDGERAVYDTAAAPLRALDRTLAEVQDAGDASPAAMRGLAERLRFDIESVSTTLHELIRLNAAEAQRSAARIAIVRAHAVEIAVFLDAISALISVLAAALALTAARRFARAMQSDVELLGDRATELEIFDQRVAHDLLSPLMTVSLAIGVIARRNPDTQTQQMLERAMRAIDRSKKLVDGILAFARSGARPRAGVRSELKAALATALDSVASAEGDALPEIRVEPFDEMVVACDPIVLVTMLTNFLSNALKYTRTVSDGRDARVTVRARASGGRVRAEVEDTGPGIPAGMEESLFDPYVRGPRVTEPGIGLGLATVKRFATAHGGAVGARRLDVGSLFWFELPVVERAP